MRVEIILKDEDNNYVSIPVPLEDLEKHADARLFVMESLLEKYSQHFK